MSNSLYEVPQGPQGPAGPQGDQGPQGPAGGGVTATQVTATATTTTTSTSDVLIDSMTISPDAGDYVIMFSSSWKNSSSADNFLSIYVNGTQVAHSERMMKMESSIIDTEMGISTHAYVASIGAAEAIEIKWRVTGGTATIRERTLIAMKIG